MTAYDLLVGGGGAGSMLQPSALMPHHLPLPQTAQMMTMLPPSETCAPSFHGAVPVVFQHPAAAQQAPTITFPVPAHTQQLAAGLMPMPVLAPPVVAQSPRDAQPVQPVQLAQPICPVQPPAAPAAPRQVRDGLSVGVELVECAQHTELEQSLADVPSMRVANSFLDKNSQSHQSALTAFGDVIDNCRESYATKLKIEVRTYKQNHLLVFTDNGCGMTEAKVREGLMSIGYTTKDLSTGKHYGFGGKTSIPRIADSCLIFTREASTRYRTVGLLSAVFSIKVGANETKMPLCSWEEHGEDLVGVTAPEFAPLTLHQREASLHFMLEAEGCPYANASALLSEFDRAWDEGATGTRLVMWGIKKDIKLKCPHAPGDILVQVSRPEMALSHDRSLRAFCEVLYLKNGDKDVPSMDIDLRDRPIEYRDWETYLHEMPSNHTLPKPSSADVSAQFKAEQGGPAAKGCAQDATASITMGYARTMQQLCELLSKRTQVQDMDDGEDDEKFIVSKEQTGFFIYHKGRMTRALERPRLMNVQNNAGQTSRMRITTLGVGLTGFIKENYLVQTHNKAGYLDQKLFDALMSNANEKAKDYLRKYTGPAHGRMMGHVAPGTQTAEPEHSTQEKPCAKEKPVALEEEVRMKPVNPNDPTVGRVVRAPFCKGRYRLRLPDFTLSKKSYLARDLVKTIFDPNKDLDLGMVAAPDSLAGCKAEVWWLPDVVLGGEQETEETGEAQEGGFFQATVQIPEAGWISPAAGDDTSGWFKFVYDVDNFAEYFFVALKPGDASIFAAYRDDGEKLPGGIELRFPIGSMPKVMAAAKELTRPRPRNNRRQNQLQDPSNSPAVPTETSNRYAILEALARGLTDRNDIVKHARGWRREDTVTTLGREKKQKEPFWQQVQDTYHLTPHGLTCSRAAGLLAETEMEVGAVEHEVDAEIEEVEADVQEMEEVEKEVEVEAEVDEYVGEEVADGNHQWDPAAAEFEVEIAEAGMEVSEAAEMEAGVEVEVEAEAEVEIDAEIEAGVEAEVDAEVEMEMPKEVEEVEKEVEVEAEVNDNVSEEMSDKSHQRNVEPVAIERDQPPAVANALSESDTGERDLDKSRYDRDATRNGKALQPGLRVKARYLASNADVRPNRQERSRGSGAGRWYEGTIYAVNEDGTCAVKYDDGDFEPVVYAKYIVPIETSGHEGASNASSSSSSAATTNGNAAVSRLRTRPSDQSTPARVGSTTATVPSLSTSVIEGGDDGTPRASQLKLQLTQCQSSVAAVRAELRSVMEQIMSLNAHSRSPAALAVATATLVARAERYLEGEELPSHIQSHLPRDACDEGAEEGGADLSSSRDTVVTVSDDDAAQKAASSQKATAAQREVEAAQKAKAGSKRKQVIEIPCEACTGKHRAHTCERASAKRKRS